MKKQVASKLVEVHARLFADDIEQLQRRAAEKRLPSWQIELRLLVHQALEAERQGLRVLREHP